MRFGRKAPSTAAPALAFCRPRRYVHEATVMSSSIQLATASHHLSHTGMTTRVLLTRSSVTQAVSAGRHRHGGHSALHKRFHMLPAAYR